jgi:ABC-2 type transport system ATP-binding protein
MPVDKLSRPAPHEPRGSRQMSAIEIEGLEKSYRAHGRARKAIESLDLLVPEGGVFGLLGPNGAGKSTTLRCLLGLVRSDKGTIRILERSIPSELPAVIGRVGSLLERPGFHPRLSGRENLEHLAQLGGVSRASVEKLLLRVDLQERAADPVMNYSMGMRQRLGIAAALLKDPAVILLDEPANGLDPGGIADMRLLARELADEGRTVVLSSHLLTEVDQIADRVSIMARGRTVFTGTLSDLLEANDPGYLFVRIDEPAAARAVLTSAGFAVKDEGAGLIVSATQEEAKIVAERLAASNIYPLELKAAAANLEMIFLRLTNDTSGLHDEPLVG